MKLKFLTLIGVLGLSLMCLNLSAATSYTITDAEAGTDSFWIFSDALTNFFGSNRQSIDLTVNRLLFSGDLHKLSLEGVPETTRLVDAGVTFKENDVIDFTRGTIADWFAGPYDIEKMTKDSEGFKDYGVESYFQLSGVNSGNTLDFQFTKSAGSGGGSQGGPLPGVLATLLLGGGSALFLKRRKQAAQA